MRKPVPLPDAVYSYDTRKIVPRVSGCYGFWDDRRKEYYRVGQSIRLGERLKTYFILHGGGLHEGLIGDRSRRLGRYFQLHIWFREERRLSLEKFLIKVFDPVFNRHHPGLSYLKKRGMIK